jgi:Flp pilus assembly pilin Flp
MRTNAGIRHAAHGLFPRSRALRAAVRRCRLSVGTQIEASRRYHNRARRGTMFKRCMVRVQEIEGRTLTDFGLILALIAVVCAGALTLFGDEIDASFAKLAAIF